MSFRQAINGRHDRNMRGVRDSKRLTDYREYVARVLKRSKPSTKKQPYPWSWELFGEKGTLLAFTRSEARAQLKERFSIKRVPQEVVLARIEE